MFVTEEVETFLAIARSGSLAQAARIVHAAQSTVSYRLSCLEKRLGQPLVLRARGANGVGLTAAGQHYRELAERWEHLVSEAARLRDDDHSTLAAGCADAISIHLFPSIVGPLLERQPRLRLTLETARSGELCERVVSGHLDVAFVFYEPVHADLRVRTLAEYPMVAVSCAELGPSDSVSVAELSGGREIYLPWGPDYDLWRQRNMLREPVHTITKAHSLPPVLRGPGTWAVVPAFMAAELAAATGCRVMPMRDEPPARVVYWVERARHRAANTAALHELEQVLTGWRTADT
ncbi:MAG: LysR family transcriptional regulator [Pseudonocardiaceae bacterium]|nr:LysR family transcriptional regulator [Pseudonocardiaceae bacterium]